MSSAGGVLATRAREGGARRQWKKGRAQFQLMRNCETAREEILMSIKDKVLAFFREEEGLTTVEYAIAGGLVSLLVIAAFQTLGTEVSRIITAIGTALGLVDPAG
jgi:pilus assembly protein Flp/PilA